MRIGFDVPEDVLHHLLDPVPIPQFGLIGQTFDTPPPISDVAGVVSQELNEAGLATMLKPGQRVAIGVGSRGIGRLPEIVRAVVSAVRSAGADPFIVPTSGVWPYGSRCSEGGGSAPGWRR